MNKFWNKIKSIVIVSVLGLVTVFSFMFANKDLGVSIIASNVAGTYTDFSTQTYIDWSTGGIILNNKIKDVYTTTSSLNSSSYNPTYAYLDSYKGPTPKEREVSSSSGTTRTTTTGASAEYSIFKLSASHSIESSTATLVKDKYTFPGDNKLHTLYQTRRHYDRNGYVSRTSYISRVSSYTYIWGVSAWNILYNPYESYPSRDYGSRYACNTIEYQYGTYMTN